MSTTITLEEALARAAKGPFSVPHGSGRKEIILQSTGITIAECFQRGSETPDPSLEAALLAHCRNVLPEVVAKAEALFEDFDKDSMTDMPEDGPSVKKAKAVFRSLRNALDKATTVLLP